MSFHRFVRVWLTIFVVIVVGCTSDSPPASPSEPKTESALTPLQLGIAIPSYVHAVAWVTKDAGIFKRHGLDVEVTVMGGSSATMKGLLSGDIDVGLAGGDAVIKADIAGGDLKVFGGVVNRFYHRLVGAKNIQTPDQLKGGSIGLPFLGGPQDMAVQFALERMGLRYNIDVEIKSLGREYARLVALDQGLISAVTASAPPALIEKLGLHVLADLPSWDVSFPYMMMVARQTTLSERAPVMTRFVQALSEGMRFYATHKDESLAMLGERLGADKGHSADAYDHSGPSLYTDPPFPDEAGMQRVIDFLAKLDDADLARAGSHKAGDFIDTTILDQLKAEGAAGTQTGTPR